MFVFDLRVLACSLFRVFIAKILPERKTYLFVLTQTS